MLKQVQYILFISLLAFALIGCQEDSLTTEASQEGLSVILIGGASYGGLTVSSEVETRGTTITVDPNKNEASSDPNGAERQKWLIQPLKKGLDITYGQYDPADGEKHERVAILKLVGGTVNDYIYNVSENGRLAEYSFNYRSESTGEETQEKAVWYDNGSHYFQGVHVPNRIRFTNDPSEMEADRTDFNGVQSVAKVVNLATDQSSDTDTGTDNDLGTYTLLTHYLGMPPNKRISATVGRIILPFQHRLARVKVYVLIDPSLGSETKIAGYNYSTSGETITPDDPTSSSIRFENVEVLAGVKDVYDQTHQVHKLTPTWTKTRKAIPHFVDEVGTQNKNGEKLDNNFIAYYNTQKKEYIYGIDTNWASANSSYNAKYNAATGTTDAEKQAYAEKESGYKKINYGKVPLYDLIVRPTYTRVDNVMFDEDLTNTTAAAVASKTNAIDFNITLNIGLEYEKHFEFDLDANYETAVFLRISREQINYDTSGAEQWEETKHNDNWYGVDNTNGNTLSKAGSSWQRAYTAGAQPNDIDADGGDGITDGGYYNESTAGNDGVVGQYLTPETWVKNLAEAFKDGKHHGDYFILNQDMTIDVSQFPIDFEFTGHLDGRKHTVTLSNANQWVECSNEVLGKLSYKKGNEGTDADYSNIPPLYWFREIAQAPSLTRSTIPQGKPIAFDMNTTYPADLTGDFAIFYKDGDEYKLFSPRTFYKKTPGSLFQGIDGSYTTNQESANPSTDANGLVIWEANVHKETNKSTVWVPTTGWRAEVLNLKVVDGTLFPENYNFPKSGNVKNCHNGSDAVNNNPDIPKYK